MADSNVDSGVLNLVDLAPDRRKVRLTKDGDLIEMATPNDLTIRQRVELARSNERREALNDKTRGHELSQSAQKKFEKLVVKEEAGTLTNGEKKKLAEMRPSDLTEDEEAELEALTNRAAEIVLFNLTPEEVAAIPYFQKEAVVLDFTMRFGTTIAKLAEATGGVELAEAVTSLEKRAAQTQGS